MDSTLGTDEIIGKLPLGCIQVNAKWKQSEIVEVLKSQYQIIYSEDGRGVDFYLSDELAVVYMTEADYILREYECRRKMAKLRNMSRVCGYVLFETTPDITAGNLDVVQRFAVLDLGLTLLTVSNQQEAAFLLNQMKSVEYSHASNPFCKKKTPLPLDESALKTISSIPGVGKIKAKQLLIKYKSLTNIGNAGIEDMKSIVGNKAAVGIWQFFRE